MTALRPGLPPVPPLMRRRPVDARGYPVPWFVEWIDDVPDFRVVDSRKIVCAIAGKQCWLCGEPLTAVVDAKGQPTFEAAFVIGPMCALNRTTSEPPSHRDCAIFASLACPFLTRPNAERREANLPAGYVEPAGIGLKRNPGCSVVWVCHSWRWHRVDNGILCQVGDPVETLWYAEGREATRAEINHSIETGLPLLLADPPTDEKEAEEGIQFLAKALSDIWKLMPGGEPETRDATAIVRSAMEKTAHDNGNT